MKKLLFIVASSLLFISTSYAAKLNNYQEIVNTLTQGKSITLVGNLDQCKIANEPTGARLTGTAILRSPNIVLIRDDKIMFREIIPVGDIEAFPQLGNVYQTSRTAIHKNNQLRAVLRVLDPVTYKDKFPVTEIICDIGKGYNVYSN